MAELIPAEVIDQVLRAAYSDVAKATAQSQQQSLAASPAATTLTPAQQAAAVIAGTAGLGATVVGASGAIAAGVARALAMLAAAPLRLVLLTKVLGLLYAAAYLAAANDAAAASGAGMPTWTAILPNQGRVPERWTGADDAAVAGRAGGGLADLLGERGIWIREMTTTQVNRVGDAIREAIEDGRPLSEARAAIDAIVHDTKRAHLIAETEYARAMESATMETYRANGVPMLQWLLQPGACELCVENAAVSPQPTSNPQWPNGSIPVHPHERCAIAPYYPPRS